MSIIINKKAPPTIDTTAVVEGSADQTKKLRFEVDGFTTGTTRVVTFPDANITIPSSFIAGTEKILTAQAESTLSDEVNLGALTTGLLKHTVSGGVSTPATAVAGTDYVVPGGALGTPSSGTLTNTTGFPASALAGLGTGVATFLATPSSANLASAVTDESGTGALLFAGGALGAATATSINGLTLTSSTGTLTVANSKTLTANNTLTLTATDGSTLAIGTGGTLGTAAYTAASAYATTALNNLASVAINADLLPGTAGGADLGGTAKPWGSIYFAASAPDPANDHFLFDGTPTDVRQITFPDANTLLPILTQTLTFTGPTASRSYTLPDADSVLTHIGNKLSVFAATTSAELSEVISDETGSSGGFVRAGSPTITSPVILTQMQVPFLFGGSGVGSSLTLRSTSGVGSSDSIVFQVGNNGATVAKTINTAGAMRWHTYGTGTITSDASGNLTSVSDGQLKDRVRPYAPGLAAVLNLRPVAYHWTPASGLDTEHEYVGFIAQDVEAILPDAIGRRGDGMRTFSDRVVIAALVTAVQELTQQVQELKRVN